MNIIITIFEILGGIVFFLLFIALFIKRNHYVKREIVINVPQQQVFDYIKLIKNQDSFNKHAVAGPERNKEFRGTDGTVGFVYAWSGTKEGGEGEKEIMSIVEGKSIETEIRFVKPMTAVSRMVMETEFVSENQTKVYWSNAGILKYPVNLLVPMMEKMLPKEMDSSLLTLKNLLEK